MREIKFKFFYTDGKEWIVEDFTLDEMMNGEPFDYLSDSPLFRDYKLVDRVQFTGLKDANGIEIYEGDILGFDWVYQDGKEFSMGLTGFVQWNRGKFLVRHGYTQFDVADINQVTFERTWREQYRQGVPDEYFKLMEIKVIGNIHENKELLS